MIIATKIRLKPTKEQETLFWKSAGVSRWAYNYFLAESERHYQEYLDGKHEKKTISEGEVRKYINNVLKKTTHTWLKEVGSNVMKQAVKDADNARKRWFKGLSEKPRFKSRHKSKISFYVNYESLKRVGGGFRGEKIGFVRTCQPLPKLIGNQKYSNPRISYDGRNWFLSVGYEVDVEEVELTNKSLGIDLGVKDLAICSDGNTYKNINKTLKLKKLNKKKRRLQKQVSRKYEMNKKGGNCYCKTNNIKKLEHKLLKLNHRISNIRNNYQHQVTSEIIKREPSFIVLEDLNIKDMMKNRHLSKAIQEQGLYDFKRKLSYKAQWSNIKIVDVPRFFPSSKTCSNCGSYKGDLKLSERTYKCESCGIELDRDYNASLNLKQYGESTLSH